MKDSINKIKDYFVSMEMYDGNWVVCVKFKPKWGAYSSEDGRIKVGPDDKVPDLWWYYGASNDVDIDEIINLINETVETNLEAIKKVELFKLKAGELKQIFSDETISFKKLQTLKFVFDDNPVESVKQEPKKRVSSKKDLMSHVGDVIQEHDVFTQETVKEEEPPKKTKKSKQKVVEELQPVSPIDMTEDEINDLRG